MPLKSIDVQLTVRGFVGNVVTTLLYKNTEQNPIEAVFEFPIDDQSAVYYFEAKIEDRVIIAECQEKKQVLGQFVIGRNRRFHMPKNLYGVVNYSESNIETEDICVIK